MNAVWAALSICTLFTFLTALIEVVYQSKGKATAASCIHFGVLPFFLILLVGNCFATLLATTLEDKLPSTLQSFFPFFYAFLGMFAFNGVLKNVNLTFLDTGVLTIQDWINKARDPAVETALKRQVEKDSALEVDTAETLRTLSDADLDAYLATAFGGNPPTPPASGDPKLYKALALFAKDRDRALAIAKQRRSR